ncbi:hypothetical protein AQ490_18220 [Wenjunlia vitaminophila]|uniref:Uncharacterized protein n=1 Tax=Wenjunlia vitaminophila TaxID=76728 RepID=A0A0T6LVA2_WENVI|nr:FxLYD domain-containing protein [Wenjunlia vitaminophila]KRV49990.1 hypothetical protein AQ490_18220 [Wenjunlia vitaminophila]
MLRVPGGLAVLALLVLTGCGGGGAAPSRTVTATTTVTAGATGEQPHDDAAPSRRSGPGSEPLSDVRSAAGRWVSEPGGARVYRVDFTVRNSTDTTSDYVIAFELLDRRGDRVADVYGDVSSLAAGQTARGTAQHHPEHDAGGASAEATRVRAVRVERFPSGNR